MGRAFRPYLPGSFFHLTARTQDRVHWFRSRWMKDQVVDFLANAIEQCDTDLYAFVIMHNPLPLVVRQHNDPVTRLMQPLLRGTALLVCRVFPVDGHVFSR